MLLQSCPSIRPPDYEGASAPWQFYNKQCSYRRQNSDEVVTAISPRQVVVNTVLSETVEPPRPLHRILLQYCCYSRGWIVVPSETADHGGELYIVEVDGVKKLRTSKGPLMAGGGCRHFENASLIRQ